MCTSRGADKEVLGILLARGDGRAGSAGEGGEKCKVGEGESGELFNSPNILLTWWLLGRGEHV